MGMDARPSVAGAGRDWRVVVSDWNRHVIKRIGDVSQAAMGEHHQWL
jgi:hypothetical protein